MLSPVGFLASFALDAVISLTLCSQVTPYSHWISHRLFRLGFVACSVPSHAQIQGWFNVCWIYGNKCESNFTLNVKISLMTTYLRMLSKKWRPCCSGLNVTLENDPDGHGRFLPCHQIFSCMASGTLLNIKTPSYHYRNSYYEDKIVSRPSYLYNRNYHAWKDGLYIETGSWLSGSCAAKQSDARFKNLC